MIVIPCEKCPLIPICRHKQYSTLLKECTTLYDLMYFDRGYRTPNIDNRVKDFHEKCLELATLIKPTRWHYTENHKIMRIS